MKLAEFRQRFPEYDDLSDSEALAVLSELFPAPESDFGLEEAMSVLAESFKGLEQALRKPEKEKKEKETDYSPLLLALGHQLSKVEAAIVNFHIPETVMPEVKIPEQKQVKSLKVKRNELGYITEIIPTY